MNMEKIESEIKKLNSIRSIYQRDLKEIEKRYKNREISDKTFDKQKRKYMSKIEKVKEKIRKLEEEIWFWIRCLLYIIWGAYYGKKI